MSIFELTLSIGSSLNKARVSEGLGAEDKRISVNQQGRGMGACLAGVFFSKTWGRGEEEAEAPPPSSPFFCAVPAQKLWLKKLRFKILIESG